MARVHAVILHHRGEEMLAACLRTLLASRDVELEVVLFANGCDEPLPPIVEEERRIHVLRSAAGVGFAEGNNRAVAWAGERLGAPDYYYFLNNDTESEPDALALLVEALERRPQAGIAGPRLMIQASPDHLNSLGLNVTADAWGWDEGIGRSLADYGPLPPEREVLAVTGAAVLVGGELLERIGGWTEIYEYYFEDIDLCLKAQAVGRTVVHVPRAVVYHRISATMTIGSERKEFYFWRNRLVLAAIHWPPGLLLALLYRALVLEIWRQRRDDRALQRRALREALSRLPRLLRERRRWRGRRAWRRHLRAPGSVPVISLPEAVGQSAVDSARPPDDRHVIAITPEREPWSELAGLAPRAGRRRLLVVGSAPLPFEEARMHFTPGFRTWQLASALATDGHAVCVLAGRIPGCYEVEPEPVVAHSAAAHGHDGLVAFSVAEDRLDADEVLTAAVRAFTPDAVVATSLLPASRACGAAADLPMWVDFPGDPMAEAQAKAVTTGAPQAAAYRHRLLPLLDRGDAFSTVSDAQRLALIGQLGLTGRLAAANAGHELVHVVELALPPGALGDAETTSSPPGELEEDDFVVLWSGGYNTWCDADTLFAGLELAMAERPQLRFVATGGDIPGHDVTTYERFRAKVASSPFADRYRILGALAESAAATYWRRADLGILCELPLYERSLGSAGRLLRWIAMGLPFVCTRLSPLGEEVERAGFAFTYPAGDAEALARRLVAAADGRAALAGLREEMRIWGVKRYGEAVTTSPLLAWARSPRRACDAGAARVEATLGADLLPFAAELRALREELTFAAERRKQLEAEYHDVRAELGRIHHSMMWKTWMLLYRLRSLLPRRRMAR